MTGTLTKRHVKSPFRGDIVAYKAAICGITHAELAERAGLHPETVSRLIRGVRRPSRDAAMAIARVLADTPIRPELVDLYEAPAGVQGASDGTRTRVL